MESSSSEDKEYNLSVRTNNIQEAIAQICSALYDLLGQALLTADDEDESDFARFALEARNVLARYPEDLLRDVDDEAQVGGYS